MKDAQFRPAQLYRMARSKAYLYRGVEIRWSCAKGLIAKGDPTPEKDNLHFPNGLEDFLAADFVLERHLVATAVEAEILALDPVRHDPARR